MLLILGILIFVVVFYCIITEKVSSAYATMLGALTMAFLGIVNEEEILESNNIIFLQISEINIY